MSLEELWQLFPITLSPHQPQWEKLAVEEIASLSALLADYSPVINHIGSTAIPDIAAKPIVDLLIELPSRAEMQQAVGALSGAGYICMSESDGRVSFNKGYTADGYAEKVYHVHLRLAGDNDEIFFRDYLIAHPGAAREYEKLKQSLLPAYRHNRDGYTEAKSEFVMRINRLAKAERDHSSEKASEMN